MEAAFQVFERDGFDAITIRTVAASLKASPMSLYRHFDSRDEIVDEVLKLVFAAAPLPRPRAGADWETLFRWWGRQLFALYKSNPAGLYSLNRHPAYVYGPSVIAPAEPILAALREAGLDRADVVGAYAALITYVAGQAAMQVGRVAVLRASGLDPEEGVRYWESVIDALPDEGFTDIKLHSHGLARMSTDEQFERGLDLLVEGVRAVIQRQERAALPPRRGRRPTNGAS